MNKGIQIFSLTAMLLFSCITSWSTKGSVKDIEVEAYTKSNAEQTYMLQLNLKDGSIYTYSMNILGHIQSGDVSFTNNIYSDCTFHVQDTKDGNKKLEMVYDLMKMELNLMGKTTQLSSEDGTAESKPIRDMMHKPFYIIINREGEILSIEGWEAIDKSGAISPEQMKQSMEYAFSIFPPKAVKIGESWQKELDLEINVFKLKIFTTYTLKEVKDNLAIIMFSSTIKMNEQDVGINNDNINLSGSQKGTMSVELSTGMTLSGTVKQDINGSADIDGASMPMSIQNEINITSRQK